MSQCHQPLPVGASGSCTNRAKLCVPLGARLQLNAGDMFCPVHPNELNTCAAAILRPCAMSGLVSAKPPFCPGVASCAATAELMTHVPAINAARHMLSSGTDEYERLV